MSRAERQEVADLAPIQMHDRVAAAAAALFGHAGSFAPSLRRGHARAIRRRGSTRLETVAVDDEIGVQRRHGLMHPGRPMKQAAELRPAGGLALGDTPVQRVLGCLQPHQEVVVRRHGVDQLVPR